MLLPATGILTLAALIGDPPIGGDVTDLIVEHARGQANADPGAALVDGIARDGVAGVRRLWTELGIASDLFSGLEGDAPVSIERHSVELNGVDGDETLLRLSDSSGQEVQYLALRRDGDGWGTQGRVELRNQRLNPPWHRVEVLGNRRWLVIQSLRGSGSGFERYQETWYAADGLKPVLSFPSGGHVRGHGMPFNRTFTGTKIGLSAAEDRPVVEVEISAHYVNGDAIPIEGLTDLFTRSGVVRYRWDSETSKFMLDEAGSALTEVEVVGIFADDAQGFLLHNFPQLRELALGDDDLKKRWLRRFLEARDDCTEKTVLQGLLDPVTPSHDDRIDTERADVT